LLGAAAVLALGLTLSSSVRRRRRTYAVLAAIGLDRGDLRQTVRWQLNLVTLLALAIGLPIGVVVGRLAWTAFADQLGVAGDPRVPVALLAAAAGALLLVANLVGEWPARTAGRRRWGVALRDAAA
jgi:predicted lysophospholipase L1 biosynthesis ABC-type transport system permease subunit